MVGFSIWFPIRAPERNINTIGFVLALYAVIICEYTAYINCSCKLDKTQVDSKCTTDISRVPRNKKYIGIGKNVTGLISVEMCKLYYHRPQKRIL